MNKSGGTRRWFQVSLKSLFILMLVVAAYFGGLATTLQEITSIRQQNDKLRAQTRVLEKERDDILAAIVQWQDELAQAQSVGNRRNNHYDQLLRMADGGPSDDVGLPPGLQMPTVFGLVRATNTSEGLVEINLGADDGLRNGDTLHVYRLGSTSGKTRYLGRIQLTRTARSISVGQILPEYSRGTIRTDDHVATRLVP